MIGLRITRSAVLWAVGIVIALMVLPFLLSSFWVSLVTEMMIYGLLAMSLNILQGYTGLPSLGHVAFFGSSAYVAAILVTKFGQGLWWSSFCGVLATIAIATLFGLIVAHASGVYFLMITLALDMCLWGVALRWVSMTSGDAGIPGVPRPDIGLPVNMWNPVNFYYFVLVVGALIFLLLYIFSRSPFGQTLQGIRESESRMRVLGYNTWVHKYLAYVIAGTFASFSGILFVFFKGFVSPLELDFSACIRPFVMCILGGPGTLLGPIVGAVIVTFLENFISSYTKHWQIFVGAVFIFCLFYAPMGVVNWIRLMISPKTVGGTAVS